MEAEFCGKPIDGKTFGDLWYLGNLIEMGIDPLDPQLTREIIAEGKPFSKLQKSIKDLDKKC